MVWKPPSSLKKEMIKQNKLPPAGDLQPPLRIVAHRRSGNHFLWESLHINYNIEDAAGVDGDDFKYHRPFNMAPEGFCEEFTCVFLVRDPRDTLVSNWFYWKNNGERRLKMQKFLDNISFSDYLRGLDSNNLSKFNPEPFDDMDLLLLTKHIEDPVGFWLDFTAWSDVSHMVMRYEDLHADEEKIIKDFGNRFNLTPTKDPILTIKKDYNGLLVGYKPRKGIIGGWKDHFSQEDLNYILDRAGDKMKEFNYI
jgi:hypothetical protein